MKPDAKTKGYRSNAGVGVKMSIDESATAHIMDILTKMYSDPLSAVIREYSTNAWDAHVMAGNDDLPIDVTLPSATNPVFKVHDQGIGLDADDIAEIYSRYGASTKRETNSAQGMLGIGCKSALSYTDQFTLTGRKNGVTTTVLISRDEDGAGSMTVVDEQTDFQPDGVTIQVPIKAQDVPEMHLKAAKFFMFWQPGTVLVDGTQPERVDGLWLDNHTLLTEDEAVGESLIVMGNVAYPLPSDVPTLYQQPLGVRGRYINGRYVSCRYHAVVFVPIGSVNFAPSRESLMDTRKTRKTLDAARRHITETLRESILAKIANAPTAQEAQQELIRGRDVIAAQELAGATWNGREVILSLKRGRPTPQGHPGVPDYSSPDDWDVEQALKYSYLYLGHARGARKSGERSTTLDLQHEQGVHIIVGFDGKNWTNVKRAKLELYMTAKGHSPMPRLVALDKLTPDEKFWLDGWTTHKWEDIAAVELPKTTTADGKAVRIRGSYDCLWKNDYSEGKPAHEIAAAQNAGTPVYWYHGNKWQVKYVRPVKDRTINPDDSIIVCLGANRIEKFKRDFPKAVRLEDAAKDVAERWFKTQDSETIKAYTVQRACETDLLKRLDGDKLADPDLRELHRLASRDVNAYTRAVEKYQRYITAKDDKAEAWGDAVLAKYPLYRNLGYNVNKDHLILYLNAAYNAEKGA